MREADENAIWILTEFESKGTDSQRKYYWRLLEKLARALHLKVPVLHNRMLRDYGVVLTFSGKKGRVQLPDTDEAERQALSAETYHLRPTSQVLIGNDGVAYRTYVMLKGSHDMNPREYANLIDGLVQECQNCGIETLTPRELEEMRINAEKHHK